MADEWDEFDPDKLIAEKDVTKDVAVTEEVVDVEAAVAAEEAAREADRLAGRGEGVCPAAISGALLKAAVDALAARLRQEEPKRGYGSTYAAPPIGMKGNILRVQPPGSYIKSTSKEAHIAIAADEYGEPRKALAELLSLASGSSERLATDVGSVRDAVRDKGKSDLQNSLEVTLPRLALALLEYSRAGSGGEAELASAVAELGASQDILLHSKALLEQAANADDIFMLLARSAGARALCLMAAAEEAVELANSRAPRYAVEDDGGKESCKATKWSNVEARSAAVRLSAASLPASNRLVRALKHVAEFHSMEKALDCIYAGASEASMAGASGASEGWENKSLNLGTSGGAFEAPKGVNKAGRTSRHNNMAPYTNVPYNSGADTTFAARAKEYRQKGWTDVSGSPLTAIGRLGRLLCVEDIVDALSRAAKLRGSASPSAHLENGGRDLVNLLLAVVDLPAMPYLLIDAALWRPWTEAAPRRGVAGEVPVSVKPLTTALADDKGLNVLWFLAYHYYSKFLYRVDCYGGFRLGIAMTPPTKAEKEKSALETKPYAQDGTQVHDEIQDGDYRHRALAVTNARRVADDNVFEALRKADPDGAMWSLLLMYTVTDRWLPVNLDDPECSPLAQDNWVRCGVEQTHEPGVKKIKNAHNSHHRWPGGWRTSLAGNELGDDEFKWAFMDVPDPDFKGGSRTTIYTTPSPADTVKDLKKPLTAAACYLTEESSVRSIRGIVEEEEEEEEEFDDGSSVDTEVVGVVAETAEKEKRSGASAPAAVSSPWRQPKPPAPWKQSCDTEIPDPHPVVALIAMPPSYDNWTATGLLPSNVCATPPWYLYGVPYEDYHRFRNKVGVSSLKAGGVLRMQVPGEHKKLVQYVRDPPASDSRNNRSLKSHINIPKELCVCDGPRETWPDVAKEPLSVTSKNGPAAGTFYLSLGIWDFLTALFVEQKKARLTAGKMRDEAEDAAEEYAAALASARDSASGPVDLTSPRSDVAGASQAVKEETAAPFPSLVADTWGAPLDGALSDVLDVELIRGWPVGGVTRVSYFGDSRPNEGAGAGASAGSAVKRRRKERRDTAEDEGFDSDEALSQSSDIVEIVGSTGPPILRAGDVVLHRPDDTIREEQVLIVSIEVSDGEVSLTLVRRHGQPHVYEGQGGRNLMLRYEGQPNSVPVCVDRYSASGGRETAVNVEGWHIVPGTNAWAATYRTALVSAMNAYRKSRLWLAALKWAWAGAQTDAMGHARALEPISDMMGGQVSEVVEAELTTRLLAAPQAPSPDSTLRQQLEARLEWLKARGIPSVHDFHVKGWAEADKSQMHAVMDEGEGEGAAGDGSPPQPLNLRGLRLDLISAGGDDLLPTSGLVWPSK